MKDCKHGWPPEKCAHCFTKIKKNKYNAEPAALFGISFRSKAERDHALFLESERRAKKIKKWEYEKSYDLFAWAGVEETFFSKPKFNQAPIGKHKPDFTVTLPDGREEVHEVKGGQATMTEAWHLRRKIFEANYPHIAYRIFGAQTWKGKIKERKPWPVIQF